MDLLLHLPVQVALEDIWILDGWAMAAFWVGLERH